MRHILCEAVKSVALLILALPLAPACMRDRATEPSPAEILSRMRADTARVSELDSLAEIAIGPGAECIDPVQHIFSYGGRTWFFNEDWGGVLEIPADYLPEDDINQAELSFHGTRAFSPDSSVCVSFHSGYLPVDFDGYCSALVEKTGGRCHDIVRDNQENAITLRGRDGEGTSFWVRHVFSVVDGVLFSVLVQYPYGRESEAACVIGMAERYPKGPGDVIFRGLCLQDVSSGIEEESINE